MLSEFKDNRYNIILKSRQLGISTLTAGYSLWMMLFNADKNILCIVNSLAIDKYKLKLQKKNIQDYSDNKTRFLVIGQNEIGSTGKDKTSFLIQTVNNPGALINILKPFEKRKINLSKIETRPSRGNINSHDFFIDCEGHQKDQKLKLAIKEVKETGSLVRILGSYPQHV